MTNTVEINEKNFKSEVIESKQPVLVDFWAPWCGPCRMMSPVINELSEKFKGQVKVVKLNTDENQQISHDFRISGIPSLLIFKDGREVERIVGFNPSNILEKRLKKYAG